MKIIDIVADELSYLVAKGDIPGVTGYEDKPEDAAVLNALKEEDKKRYMAIESAFNARAGHYEDQFFKAGLALGLQLAAETFNGLAETKLTD